MDSILQVRTKLKLSPPRSARIVPTADALQFGLRTLPPWCLRVRYPGYLYLLAAQVWYRALPSLSYYDTIL